MSALGNVRRRAIAALIPPPRLRLPKCIDRTNRLPELPGAVLLQARSPTRSAMIKRFMQRQNPRRAFAISAAF